MHLSSQWAIPEGQANAKPASTLAVLVTGVVPVAHTVVLVHEVELGILDETLGIGQSPVVRLFPWRSVRASGSIA